MGYAVGYAVGCAVGSYVVIGNRGAQTWPSSKASQMSGQWLDSKFLSSRQARALRTIAALRTSAEPTAERTTKSGSIRRANSCDLRFSLAQFHVDSGWRRLAHHWVEFSIQQQTFSLIFAKDTVEGLSINLRISFVELVLFSLLWCLSLFKRFVHRLSTR